LAQLTKKILKCLPFTVDSVHLWTDSRIVLCWLRTYSRQWTSFVANRIAEIQRLMTDEDSWKHVPSQKNPADPLSRSVMPHLLGELQIWWSGPSWLESDKSFQVSDIELPERKATTLMAEVKIESQHDIFNRFSKFSRLIRVIAFCYRFIKNCSKKNINSLQSDYEGKIGKVRSLSIEELEQSELALVRIVQREAFKTELCALEGNKPVNKNSNILNLNPFIDAHGILRVGGRLRHASVSYNYKHPILLPGKHPFTRLIITHEHERHLHVRAQATMGAFSGFNS